MADKTPLEAHEELCDERMRGLRFRLGRIEAILGLAFSGILWFLYDILTTLSQIMAGG